MSSPLSLDALTIKVENLEKEVAEIKHDRREIDKLLMDAILSLEKNSERQTVLMEKMQEHVEKQDQRLNKLDEKLDDKFEKMDEKIDKVNLEVQAIKTRGELELQETATDSNKNLFWTFMESNGKFVLVAFILFLLVIAVLMGVNIEDLLKVIV